MHTIENSIIVKSSLIEGMGIFTNVDIKPGQTIMLIKGEVISGDECERREEEGNVYIFWNGDNYIDVEKTSVIKYINHHCEPNCDVVDNDDESLLLVSSRLIKYGEELTIDYGYDEIYDYCRCSFCTTMVA